MIIVDLIKNLALLVALSVFSGFVGERCRRRHGEAVWQGLLFGVSAVIGMLHPVVLSRGVIFDGRSVLLCLCGLFFGPVAVAVAAAVAVSCRLWLGGDGWLMGVLVIVSSSAFGVLFHARQQRIRAEVSVGVLACLGAIVHAAMVMLMLCLPYPASLDALRHLTLPVLLVYPLVTILMGRVLADQHARNDFLRMLHESREEFRTALYSIGDAIITADDRGCVRQLNREAERLLGVREEAVRGLPHGEVFRVVDEATRAALESPIDFVLRERKPTEIAGSALLVASDGSLRPIADSSSPIRSENGEITGVVLVFRDQTSERQAQRTLQAERDNLRAVMTSSPVAIMVLDGEACVVSANPAADRLFHRDGKPVEGIPCGDYLGCRNGGERGGVCGEAESCAACALRAGVREVLATRRGLYEREAEQTLFIDGAEQTFCIRFSMEPVVFAGAPHVMVAMSDVTDHKRAERALRESEQRYRVLADAGQGLIWTTGVDKACDFMNQTCVAFTGLSREQLLGVGWHACIHPDDRAAVVHAFGAAFDRRERWSFVFRLRRSDGVYRWMQVQGVPRYDLDCRFIGYIDQSLDITESLKTADDLRRIEWMLAKKPKTGSAADGASASGRRVLGAAFGNGLIAQSVSREMLANTVDEFLDLMGTSSSIFEANGDLAYGVWESELCKLLGPVGCEAAAGLRQATETSWNECVRQVVETRAAVDAVCPSGLRLYAVPILARSEVVGGIAFSYGDLPRDAESICRLAACCGVGVAEFEQAVGRYDSRPPYIIEMAKRRLQASAWLIGSLVSARLAEEARTNAETQLQQAQKMEAIGRLAGGMAHDFNNVLQAIIGYGELLVEHLPPQGEESEYAKEVVEESKRAALLTHQLLTFARKQVVDPKVFELNEAVGTTLKMLRRLLGGDIDLVWTPAAEPCVVKLDVGQLDQILTNLAVNARDAIEGVGKLSIETSRIELDPGWCAFNPGSTPGRYILLKVTDDGCGMDPTTLDRLFEPFFTTKEKGKGTGLGLATIYGIVRQSGGFITVKSAIGRGTSFWIYLPEHVGVEPGVDEPPRREVSPAGHETILVVDDEESLLRAGRRMLEGLGYTILTASSPDEAIKLVKTHAGEIDVLLTDVVMPGMSGRDLWRKVEPMRPSMKCVYMSGFTANIIAQRGLNEKPVNFIQKPFTKTALANKLREVLMA